MSKKDIKNYFVQGTVLIDVDGSSLNNLGVDKTITDRNHMLTKSIRKGKSIYSFISGQAWRYWWRESCAINELWNLSPITKEGDNYVTEANPIDFKDDDIFGYMRAPKSQDTFTRKSPLKNSILVSISPVRLLDDFSVLNRQQNTIVDANPMPYGNESYSAIMKGMFSIDLDQIGTFTSMNRSGYQNISEKMKNKLIEEKKVEEITDLIDTNVKRVRLKSEERIERVSEVINALKTISGGAKLTTNYNSVKPDFIILAIIKGGNNPFDNIAINEKGESKLSVEAIQESISDNKDYLKSDIYIGKASGFMNEFDLGKITSGQETYDEVNVHIGSVNTMIDKFISDNIKNIIEEMDK